jgi:hypothetical protein
MRVTVRKTFRERAEEVEQETRTVGKPAGAIVLGRLVVW